MEKKNAVVLGKGELSIQIAQWFHESPAHRLIAVVPVVPEPTFLPSLTAWAEAAGVPVVASGHYRDLLGEGATRIDLAMSVFYDRIIRRDFIDACGRILNLHNSPLPRYRGVRSSHWALKNGEREHGVTIHEITPGVDDGPIVSQVRYPLWPEFDEVGEVYTRALAFGWTLFQQTLPLLDQIAAQPQDESQATMYRSSDNHLLGERGTMTRAEFHGRG